jgi:hypothetical protein
MLALAGHCRSSIYVVATMPLGVKVMVDARTHLSGMGFRGGCRYGNEQIVSW